MKKNASIIIAISALSVVLAVVAIIDHIKSPLTKYIEEQTDYTIYKCDDYSGAIDIVVGFQDGSQVEEEEYAQYCARIVLIAIKNFPRESKNWFKDVSIRVINKEKKQIILRVVVKPDRFINEQWETLHDFQIPDMVDYYFFNKLDAS